jgi:hypothetical protein
LPRSSQTLAGKKLGAKAKKKPQVRRKKVYWNKVDAKEGNVWSALKKLDIKLKHLEEFDELFSQAIGVDEEREQKETSSQSPTNSSRTVKVIE